MAEKEEKAQVLSENLEKWLSKNDPYRYIRLGDTIFHEVLEFNDETLEFSTGLYSQGSWTPGYTRVFTFPNGQDFANTDTTGVESIKIHLPSLEDELADKIRNFPMKTGDKVPNEPYYYERAADGDLLLTHEGWAVARYTDDYLYFDFSDPDHNFPEFLDFFDEDEQADIEDCSERYVDPQWVEEGWWDNGLDNAIRQALEEVLNEEGYETGD